MTQILITGRNFFLNINQNSCLITVPDSQHATMEMANQINFYIMH